MTLAGTILAMVLAFPFGFGLKYPRQFGRLDDLYSRVIIITAGAVTLGMFSYELGAKVILANVVEMGLLSNDDLGGVEAIPPYVKSAALVSGCAAFLYIMALTIFRRSVISAIIDEMDEK